MTTGMADRAFKVKSYLLGERIEARNIAPEDYKTVVQTPRILEGKDGVRLAIFRFGALVIAYPERVVEPNIPAEIQAQVVSPFDQIETETLSVTCGDPGDGRVKEDDRFVMIDLSSERFSILANALAKSVALARDERRIHAVFEKLEPFARRLARSGGWALGPASSLKLLGEALLAQHRMVGRVEVHEKPDILWERPDLLRLHVRLDEEYELTDRARELSRKLKVVEETSSAIADVADAYISRRLEIAIVVLILFEIVLSLYALFSGQH
ncbi:MAG TPA: RMD1 family protein [Hyphomonadaceae bacterium]|nr:RMD1 family protein [Hyphomonadaceae bacterium]